jgi:hypothetical protein
MVLVGLDDTVRVAQPAAKSRLPGCFMQRIGALRDRTPQYLSGRIGQSFHIIAFSSEIERFHRTLTQAFRVRN